MDREFSKRHEDRIICCLSGVKIGDETARLDGIIKLSGKSTLVMISVRTNAMASCGTSQIVEDFMYLRKELKKGNIPVIFLDILPVLSKRRQKILEMYHWLCN